MKNHIKLIITVFIVIGVALACSKSTVEKITKTEEQKKKDREKTVRDSLDAIKKDQYIMAEMYTDDKTLMIDLIKGPATFEIFHEGTGHFKATITTVETKEVLLVLADVDGNFKGSKEFMAPETDAFLLDVQVDPGCKWYVKRK